MLESDAKTQAKVRKKKKAKKNLCLKFRKFMQFTFQCLPCWWQSFIMNLYLTTSVWVFIQLSSSAGYHQNIEWNQALSGSWCTTSQQGKKFCLSLNYSGTEIIFYFGLFFRLKKTLVCESHIECTNRQTEFLIKLPNLCEAN